jgi:hypothetical protein
MNRVNILVGSLMLASCGAAWAEAPVCCASDDHHKPSGQSLAVSSTELGKVSPSATNLSLVPDYQVFQFTRDGIRYLEVADAAGTPRAAFTVAQGALITLPIGQDAMQQVAVAPTWQATVFDDGVIAVAKRLDANGATVWQVFVK